MDFGYDFDAHVTAWDIRDTAEDEFYMYYRQVMDHVRRTGETDLGRAARRFR